jgi:hypothetical protein
LQIREEISLSPDIDGGCRQSSGRYPAGIGHDPDLGEFLAGYCRHTERPFAVRCSVSFMCAIERCTCEVRGMLTGIDYLEDRIMSIRFLACLAASLSIFFSGSLLAQDQGHFIEMKQIQLSLSIINSELRANLDQILMLGEAIKANARPSMEEQNRSADPVMYDDMVAAQRRVIQRETVLNARLDALLARSAQLDAQKQPLLERIQEIGMLPYEPVPKSGKAQK